MEGNGVAGDVLNASTWRIYEKIRKVMRLSSRKSDLGRNFVELILTESLEMHLISRELFESTSQFCTQNPLMTDLK